MDGLCNLLFLFKEQIPASTAVKPRRPGMIYSSLPSTARKSSGSGAEKL